MKDWQCGIELEDLLDQEKIWARYNKVCLSPFLEQKKHRMIDINRCQPKILRPNPIITANNPDLSFSF